MIDLVRNEANAIGIAPSDQLGHFLRRKMVPVGLRLATINPSSGPAASSSSGVGW